MKKDITIPQVKEVFIAAINQFNEAFNTYDWNVYIINNTNTTLTHLLIVSQGSLKDQKTSTMRHHLKTLPPKSFAKIEFIEDAVLAFKNVFKVSYFIDNQLYDKVYEFPSKSILADNAISLPLLKEKGVLAR